MKKLHFRPILIAVLCIALCPLLTLANTNPFKGKITKEKTVKKEFTVAENALLKVSNKYGNLNISSWNENRILIEVHIQTNGNNEEKVQNKLDEISIAFDASTSSVSAKTVFGEEKSSWGWNWGKHNDVNMQINYTIKLPVKNSINLINDYGNIVLDRIDGHAKINCDYGRLDLGELRGRNNDLTFDYTSKSKIGYMHSGEIRADYSEIHIEKAGNLNITADYTNVRIDEMENLQYNGDYGNLDVGAAQQVDGNGDYVSIALGTISGNIDINTDYGAIAIADLTADPKTVTMRTNYTGVKIGYQEGYHFNFDITTRYAGVSGKDAFEFTHTSENGNAKEYRGYHGSNATENHVRLHSDYGGISFTKK